MTTETPAADIPRSDEINNLPEHIRRYIMRLETDADPSGTIRSEMHMREQAEYLEAWCTRLRAENVELQRKLDEAVKALAVADAAITEMFRYYDGGETRGSYDGKPERAGLRKAGYVTRAVLTSIRGESE